ncbi:excisionase/Xis, DNA-binding [Bacteroides sp. 3_1_23]|nr:excisionase/Xis, DNA-binding [Bacteroides sp. 3_1_23]
MLWCTTQQHFNNMEEKNVFHCRTASNAAIAHLRDVQVIEKLEKDSNILYDLFDLEKIFKVTKRTLFNWRAKGDLPLIEFGGKLYLSKGQLRELIIQKGGVL